MIARGISSSHKFSGRVTVNRGFSYIVKVLRFRASNDGVHHSITRTGKILGLELKPSSIIDWVEMEFKITSSRPSMRKTFQILTENSVKRLFALEASKYAKQFAKSLRGENGENLHLEFEPPSLYTNHVDLTYDHVGCPLGGIVKVKRQGYIELRSATGQI